MKNVFIFSSGTLIKKDNTICFENENKIVFFPIKSITDIHVFGEINLNKRVLEALSSENIHLFFYSYTNHFIGSFWSKQDLRGDSTILQAQAYIDQEKRLIIAKALVKAAADNIVSNLRYYNKNIKSLVINNQIKKIEKKIKKLEVAENLNILMAHEGMIRSDYYECFDIIIKNKDFNFEKRSFNPPLNHVNALISLFNTNLYNFITSIIHEMRLNISIGFLHSSNRRTESLNLDISEIYKPILVDRFVFKVINKKMVYIKDFNSDFYLDNETLKSLIYEFNKSFYKTQKIKNCKYTYITLMKKDIQNLKRHLNKNTKLNFFKKSDK